MMRKIMLAFFFLMISVALATADALTLTTYYPSPSGDYQNLCVSGNLGIGVMTPAAALDVRGTVRLFGLWQALTANTVYRATTDGFIVSYATGAGIIEVYSDGFNPPGTLRFQAGSGSGVSAMVPVRKGDYWKVQCMGIVPVVQWLPLGN